MKKVTNLMDLMGDMRRLEAKQARAEARLRTTEAFLSWVDAENARIGRLTRRKDFQDLYVAKGIFLIILDM